MLENMKQVNVTETFGKYTKPFAKKMGKRMYKVSGTYERNQNWIANHLY